MFDQDFGPPCKKSLLMKQPGVGGHTFRNVTASKMHLLFPHLFYFLVGIISKLMELCIVVGCMCTFFAFFFFITVFLILIKFNAEYPLHIFVISLIMCSTQILYILDYFLSKSSK